MDEGCVVISHFQKQYALSYCESDYLLDTLTDHTGADPRFG